MSSFIRSFSLGINKKVQLGSGLSPKYIWLNDTFSTDLAGGSVNGTLSDSGHLRTIVDTANSLAISSGNLSINGNTGAWGNPRLDYPAQCHSLGSCLEFIAKIADGGQYRIGWRGTANVYHERDYFWFVGTTLYPSVFNSVSVTTNTFYSFRIISGGDRIYTLIKGGTQFTNWTLLSVQISGNPTNSYPSLSNVTCSNGKIDSVKIINTNWTRLGKNFSTINTSPWSITMPSANAFIQFSWVCKTSDTLNIAFRQSDSTHRLIIRCSQSGSTIKLIADNGGETELASAAQTFTNTSVYVILIKCNGTSIQALVNDTSKISATSSLNQTELGANVSGFTYGADLTAIPLAFQDADLVETTTRKSYNIWHIGDSKTAGSGDIITNRGYPPLFCALVNGMEVPARIGVGGMNTATLKARIDNDCSNAVGSPDYILYNMGENDGGVFNALWKTNTGYIFDALHTKFPNAKIYCASIWDRTGGSALNTSHISALNEVLSTRSFVTIAVNEYTVLENADNGYLYTSDGVHPNRLGYQKMAEAWKAGIGL